MIGFRNLRALAERWPFSLSLEDRATPCKGRGRRWDDARCTVIQSFWGTNGLLLSYNPLIT